MTRVRRLLAAIVLAGLFATPAVAEIFGAGSTLAHPILARWSQAFQRSQADAEYQPVGAGLDYEFIGSQAGIMRLRDGAVDFGATDVPLSDAELKQFGFGQFPIVVGGVVVAVNVRGVASGQMRLTGELVADIYLGRVKTWSDPAIAALNPGLTLPDAAITVLRRSDGSGTTFAFTEFLSSASADWRGQLGSGLTVAWPVGSAAKGNDGMADAMRRTANAIGYVDFAQARRAGLTATLVRNRANVFVGPSVESFRAAADSAGLGSSTANVSLTNMAGEGSYPIVATTYAVMRSRPNTTRGGRDTIEFFRWAFDNGAPAASELGYVALPASLVAKVKEYWLTAF